MELLEPSSDKSTEVAEEEDHFQAGEQLSRNETDLPLQLPKGFSISIFADQLKTPRVMVWDPNGVMITSITKSDKVVALPDRDGDGKADGEIIVADGLNRPHGLAFKCDPDLPTGRQACKLYIAESHRVSVLDYDPITFKVTNPIKLAGLPDRGRHFTRTILFRPAPHDNELLVSIGSSCDTCYEKDERRASIWSLNVETKEFKLFARGLRNAVFIANHPNTEATWVTDMGRDHLGDDLPPDEINIVEEGGNYGWPLCYGKNIHDRVFDDEDVVYIRAPCSEPFEKPSHIDIPAHSSPLGLAFFPDSGWPEEFSDDLLVVYHGSWNRTIPTGYKLVRFQLDAAGNFESVEDFISGWLRADNSTLGRPADVLFGSDRTIYVSDDKAGVIYRLTYSDSGRLERAAEQPGPGCVVSGCNSEICAEEIMFSPCVFRPEFQCYREARCERQADGQCRWTMSDALRACIEELSGSERAIELID